MSKQKFIWAIILCGVIFSAVLITFWFPLKVDDTVCYLSEGCPSFVEFVRLYELKSIIVKTPTLIFKPHYVVLPLHIAMGFVASYLLLFTYRLLKHND